ncbi:MAG: hypothetical protein C4570_02025 [Ammonifex sp.]|jgi:hypothetical protein|nr:MAG: hypothetical protein C4570_02025 [Ammonifex sp.]
MNNSGFTDIYQEIGVGFILLLEQIEALIQNLNTKGAEAFRDGRYANTREIMNQAEQVIAVKEQVETCKKKWKDLLQRWEQFLTGEITEASTASPLPKEVMFPEASIPQRDQSAPLRTPRGMRTPEELYCQPILEALVELGGAGSVEEVLDRVGRKMEGILNDFDREVIPSGGMVRWRKVTQWCRLTMVKEGLLAPNSPRGVWEISEAGRAELARLRANSG